MGGLEIPFEKIFLNGSRLILFLPFRRRLDAPFLARVLFRSHQLVLSIPISSIPPFTLNNLIPVFLLLSLVFSRVHVYDISSIGRTPTISNIC